MIGIVMGGNAVGKTTLVRRLLQEPLRITTCNECGNALSYRITTGTSHYIAFGPYAVDKKICGADCESVQLTSKIESFFEQFRERDCLIEGLLLNGTKNTLLRAQRFQDDVRVILLDVNPLVALARLYVRNGEEKSYTTVLEKFRNTRRMKEHCETLHVPYCWVDTTEKSADDVLSISKVFFGARYV